MIAIVHYGAGNIRSVSKAFEKAGADVHVTEDPSDVLKADKIVLPGVGAFGKAALALSERHLMTPIREAVSSGRPFLGICLGMQLLFESSEESPESRGLGIFRGRAVRFPAGLKVPHLGWNQVIQTHSSPLWKDVPDRSFFYFAHSYYVRPEDESIVSGRTEYGVSCTSAIQRDAVFGVQFHPEKSQNCGLKILANFINI